MTSNSDLQARLDGILGHRSHAPSPHPGAALGAAAPPAPTGRPFSSFRLTDVYRANQLAATLMAADRATRLSSGGDPESAVEAAPDEATRAFASEDPEMVKHAGKLYLTHHPHGTALRMRSLEVREPFKVLPSVEADGTGALPDSVLETNPELRLAWWREDPKPRLHDSLASRGGRVSC